LLLKCSYSQNLNSWEIFLHTHGIKQEPATFYEIEDYSIFVQIHKYKFDEKGINKVKCMYAINKELIAITDSTIMPCNIYVTSEVRTKNVTQSNVYYILPKGSNEIKVIGLQTTNLRNEELEKFMVKAILINSIPKESYTTMAIESINFAGREIKLGNACHWMKPHNIQCSNLGQMNWAEFGDIDRAKKMIECQMDITENKNAGTALKKDTIDVVFEGNDTKALKMTYKVNVPELLWAGSNILVIYYIATNVRGRYIGCVLSHYADDISSDGLPPLLSEVMILKK